MTALGAARLAGLVNNFYKKEDFLKENITKYSPSMKKEEVENNYNRWKKAVKSCLQYKL